MHKKDPARVLVGHVNSGRHRSRNTDAQRIKRYYKPSVHDETKWTEWLRLSAIVCIVHIDCTRQYGICEGCEQLREGMSFCFNSF